MIVAVPKETYPEERRIALIPQAIPALTKAGLEVVVEAGAGEGANIKDDDFEAQGARVEQDRQRLLSQADVVLMVRGPGSHADFPAADLDVLKEGTTLIAFLEPLAAPATMKELADRKLTVFAMELMPRTTRAQVGQGQPVPFGKLRAGDLVFFKPPSYPRHVGIYLGGFEFVHASKNKGVTLSKIDKYYWGKYFWTARRILPASDHH